MKKLLQRAAAAAITLQLVCAMIVSTAANEEKTVNFDIDGVLTPVTSVTEGQTSFWIKDGTLLRVKVEGAIDTLEIPDTVEKIDVEALYMCSHNGITKIIIPSSVKMMSGYIFDYMDDCEEIVVDKDNESYCSLDGAVYTKDMKELVAYPNNKQEQYYIMPDTLEKVWNSVGYPQYLNYVIYSSKMEKNILAKFWFSPVKAIYLKSDLTELGSGIEEIETLKTIYGPSNSLSEAYASENNLDYVVIDGELSLANVSSALHMALGIEETTLDLQTLVLEGREQLLYDVDGDNQVSMNDVTELLYQALQIVR